MQFLFEKFFNKIIDSRDNRPYQKKKLLIYNYIHIMIFLNLIVYLQYFLIPSYLIFHKKYNAKMIFLIIFCFLIIIIFLVLNSNFTKEGRTYLNICGDICLYMFIYIFIYLYIFLHKKFFIRLFVSFLVSF